MQACVVGGLCGRLGCAGGRLGEFHLERARGNTPRERGSDSQEIGFRDVAEGQKVEAEPEIRAKRRRRAEIQIFAAKSVRVIRRRAFTPTLDNLLRN